LAGIIPGLLICAGLMLVTARIAKKRNYPVASSKASWGERGSAFKASFLPLLTPVILLGGILLGVFTPTEAAAVAVGYALIIALFVTRTMKASSLPSVLVNSAVQAGSILLLVGSAVTFAWIITVSGMAELIAHEMAGLTDNILLLLLLINLFLFAIGMFLDAGPAILILGPVLAPIFISLGIDPLHFAIVMCVNLTVGLATPPMGLVLFVASSVSGEKTENIALEMLPFLAVEAGVIFLITYFPALTMTLPTWFGYA
jgi:tripartite ATP-independent transporter DctM subunit